ncbi:MAG: hypothetical protein ACXWKG_15365 [Limisphaerales bacterium]
MNANLRNITNNFHDVRLASLASWRQANEFFPRDHGGPYVVLQEGYDPQDMKMRADEFILGRSGKWLRLGLFYQMPVRERRAEFVFGTAAEVMKVMGELPAKVSTFATPEGAEEHLEIPADDEMAKALEASKQHSAV